MDLCFSRRSFLSLAATSVAAPLLPAQEQPGVTFKADVNVVNLFANVLTKKGEIINDLSKDDFLLLEDGRPTQTIQYFSRETDLSVLTLGLLVDTSASQEKVIDAERTACFHFLDQVLRDGEKIMSSSCSLIPTFSSARDSRRHSGNSMKPSPRSIRSLARSCNRSAAAPYSTMPLCLPRRTS